MKTLAERLIWARTQKGLSQSELAKAAGVAQSTIGNLEAGIRLSSRKIAAIASVLGVNALWLAEGKGDPIPKSPEDGFDINVSPASVGSREIPLISYVQAGAMVEVCDPYAVGAAEKMLWTDLDVSVNAFALTIRGSSMTPEYNEGDVIIVDPSIAPSPGNDVVAKNSSEEATFKRYRLCGINENGADIFELIPLNPNFPSLRSDRTPIHIIGVVVEHRRFPRRK